MLFNSLHFALFFPVVTGLYFLCPGQWRWLLLLIASCYFYMALIPAYVLILFFLILVDYVAALLIADASGARRRALLISSLVANLSVLFFFKYFDFINESVTRVLGLSGLDNPVPMLHWVLPVGLSFHTFQSMSYTIEVYRGKQAAERHLGIYALYVMFYPQLVAGPIERPQHILHQFHSVHSFDSDRISAGLRQMLWGLIKKVVVADRLAVIVNSVYADLHQHDGVALALATYLFAFQIYCDFSGYSDVAVGAAKVMGFNLMTNFDRPYASRSVSEFWRRWHISLSTWFRDYVYIPLGGNRGSPMQRYRNALVVFLLSGVWHGANWTFAIWGGLHGAFLVLSLMLERARARASAALRLHRVPRLMSAARVLFTFHLVTLAWVFFRAPTIHDACYVLTHLFRDVSPTFSGHDVGSPEEVALALGAVAAMVVAEWAHARYGLGEWLVRQARPLRWASYYAGVLALVFLGSADAQPFIYFQF